MSCSLGILGLVVNKVGENLEVQGSNLDKNTLGEFLRACICFGSAVPDTISVLVGGNKYLMQGLQLLVRATLLSKNKQTVSYFLLKRL